MQKKTRKRKPSALFSASLPVKQIKKRITEKGDDERRKESLRRAPAKRGLKEFKVDLDPSWESHVIPRNTPKLGKLPGKTVAASSEDGSLAETDQVSRDPDQVSAVNSILDMGAIAPASMKEKHLQGGGKETLGFMGRRNIGNEDLKGGTIGLPLSNTTSPSITSSTSTTTCSGPIARVERMGPNGLPLTELVPPTCPTQPPTTQPPNTPSVIPDDAKGNQLVTSKQVTSAEQDTLRPLYGIANPMDAIPSERDQRKSTLLFNDFSIVSPGFGLGVTNKMFLMNESWEHQLHFREPMAFPRTDIGRTDLVQAPPIEWQSIIPSRDIQRERIEKTVLGSLAKVAKKVLGQGSLNLLGDDYGLLRSVSAKGLNRPTESVFEPTILKPTPPERVRVLTGIQLESRQFRRLFDAQRWPEHFVSQMAMEGGSTWSRQKAYRVAPFPIGSS